MKSNINAKNKILFLFSLFAITAIFSPSLSYAQSPTPSSAPAVSGLLLSERYCGKNADHRVFTGIEMNGSGNPEIDIKVDPDFEAKTLRGDRKVGANVPFGDLPVTPIYDLVVTVIPSINHYCLPEWDKDSHFVREANPPSGMPYSASIALGDPDNGGEEIVSTPSFSRIPGKNEDGAIVYQWKIKGWPNGIAGTAKMEKLIKALQTGSEAVTIIVKVPLQDGGLDTYSVNTPFSLCAPINGSGKNGFVYMKGQSSSLSLSSFISTAQGSEDKFANTEPFKSNQKYFSHFIDLSIYDDTTEPVKSVKQFVDRPEVNFFKDITFPARVSSCQNKNNIYVFFNEATYLAYSELYSKNIFVYDTKANLEKTVVHEAGHAFAGIYDEYTSAAQSLSDDTIRALFAYNCSISPSVDYSYDNKLYGSPNLKGCYGGTLTDGTYVHRPSVNSIMDRGDKFNIVSCGHIMRSILERGSGEQYYPYCYGLGGLEDSGIDYKDIGELPPLNGANQVAAVNATAPQQNGRFLMVDNFDQDDPWGGAIPLDDQGNILVPKQQDTPPKQGFFSKLISSAQNIISSIVKSVDLFIPGSNPSNHPSPTPSTTPTPSKATTSKSTSPSPTNTKIFTPTPTTIQNNQIPSPTPKSTNVATPTPRPTTTASPNSSPTPSGTSRPSISPQTSPTTSVTALPTTTLAPSTTAAPTSSPAPAATPIATPTFISTPSITPSLTPAPTVTVTPVTTPFHTPTPTTVSPTNMPTTTATPMPTSTLTPTATPKVPPTSSPSPSGSPTAFRENDATFTEVFSSLSALGQTYQVL